jgi:hypothetical protein
MVYAPDQGEQLVMVDSHDADGPKGREECQILGPLVEQLCKESWAPRRGHSQIQDEQRDGYRKDGIAEPFDSLGPPA